MFIKYTLREEFLLPADEYTANMSRAVKNYIFKKYLFQIVSLHMGGVIHVICVKIDSIEILDNIILRKSADAKVKVMIAMTVLRLLDDEYYEGVVSEINAQGVKVNFLAGMLTGTIGMQRMHADTVFNEENNKWIYIAEGQQGYQWKIGAPVRFRISSTSLGEEENAGSEDFSNMIQLKADENGLGPSEWWV